MTLAYLLLGDKLGDRFAQVSIALQKIKEEVGPVICASSVYETQAWGTENQPAYLNQVIAVDTELTVRELLETIQKIEVKLGRTRVEKWGSRLIDIDILFYGTDGRHEPVLTVPYP